MDTSIPSTAALTASPPVNVRGGLGAQAQAGGRGVAGAASYEAIARGQGGTDAENLVEREAWNATRLQASQQTPGRIRFVTLDGVQATQYFDSKDILIYQVPSPGWIHLIKLEENSDRKQLEAQA